MVNLLRPPSVPSSRLGTVTGLWRERSAYDRRTLNIGIVHFGPGRFFRGHLAYIIHNYLAQKGSQDQRWGICGVSFKSRRAIISLEPQEFLYTLSEHSSPENRESAEVIGSISEIVDAREERDYVQELMTSASVHLVTLTITQAGYHLDKSFNLNYSDEEILHDLRNPSAPTTAIGLIVEALRQRRDRGITPFTTLSCDNLPRNGEILRRAVLAYADLIDPFLAEYIRDNATFPNTVVDRIVPQEQESDYNYYPSRLLQVRDRSPIVTEPFWQFVVEDNFTGDRPCWEDTGVIMTSDITPFLYMKSRFLNAVHSYIACLAVRAGIEYMHQAIALPEFHLFTRLLMSDIAAATPVPRQMSEQYMAAVLLRLSNEALPDSIERISSETARKVGKYIFPILNDAYSRHVSMKRLILPIAAWLLAVREGAIESGQPYHAKDTLSVVTAIREGAVISGILGLEKCELTEVVDDECHQALRDLQTHGLLTTLKNYS